MSSSLYQKRRKRPELNLVPLIDVLVMLIFFAFVTMQFKSAATLNITLPKVETAGKNEFKGKVTIGIDKDGVVSFNNKTVTDERLLELLREVRNIDKDIPVLIKADETTQLKKLAFVMDACRKTGLNKFSLQSR
ncbi:MAG: biopolymer transporter ExbD [Opitutaceae bacterium]|nr:biopolymer transporter ExbD [Opitutaceae bacterium]MBP9913961.1 biopolymer transporter ExbD [Opitutaceae bacterium]